MKRLLKNASAFLLAVAIMTGLVSFASADGYGRHVVNLTVHHNEYAPDNVIQVVMPTKRADMFSFIVDPNGYIQQNHGQRYAEEGKPAPEFIGNGHLYFKNVASDGTVSYSADSDALKIVNKSTVPLEVELSVVVDTGGKKIDFAATEAFRSASGEILSGPAMYLALVSDKMKVPVLNQVPIRESGWNAQEGWIPESGSSGQAINMAVIKDWIDKPDDTAYETYWNGTKYAYRLRTGTPESAFKDVSFHLHGAINSSTGWNNFGEDATLTVTWGVGTRTGPNTNPYVPPSVTVLQTGPAVQMTVNVGYKHHLSKLTYSYNGNDRSFVPTIEGNTVSFNMLSVLYNGSSRWRAEFVDANGANVESVVFDPSSIGTYVSAGGNSSAVEPSSGQTPTIKVVAVGPSGALAINCGSMDHLNAIMFDRNGIEARVNPTVKGNLVTYQVAPFVYNTATNWRAEFVDINGNNPMTVSFNPEAVSSDVSEFIPSVQVTAVGPSGALRVNVGYQDHLNCLIFYRNGNDVRITPSVNGNTVTYTVAPFVYNTATNWRAEFVDSSNSNPVVVSFDPSVLGA